MRRPSEARKDSRLALAGLVGAENLARFVDILVAAVDRPGEAQHQIAGDRR